MSFNVVNFSSSASLATTPDALKRGGGRQSQGNREGILFFCGPVLLHLIPSEHFDQEEGGLKKLAKSTTYGLLLDPDNFSESFGCVCPGLEGKQRSEEGQKKPSPSFERVFFRPGSPVGRCFASMQGKRPLRAVLRVREWGFEDEGLRRGEGK